MNLQLNKWYEASIVSPECTDLEIKKVYALPYKELNCVFVIMLSEGDICIAARVSFCDDILEWQIIDNKYTSRVEVDNLNVRYWMALQYPDENSIKKDPL